MRKFLAIAFVALTLTACGQAEQAPPADVDDGATLAHIFDDCHVVPGNAVTGPMYDCG
jgi:hypothetical protein